MVRLQSRLIAIFLSLVFVEPAAASSVLFEGSDGDGRSASALFEVGGASLVVTLTNTSPHGVLQPIDVLTAVFFDIEGDPSLSRESAEPAPGSTVLHAPTTNSNGTPLIAGTEIGDGIVGGEWAYQNNLAGAPRAASQGNSSSGLDLVRPRERFAGIKLQGLEFPNGLQYGMTAARDAANTGNTPVTGINGLIQNSVIFTLSGLPSGFDVGMVSNVFVQSGTDLTEPNFAGAIIPEPASVSLFALGTIALAGFGWRKRRCRRRSADRRQTELTG